MVRQTRRPALGSGRDRTAPRPVVVVTRVESVGFLLADVSRLMRKEFDRRVRSLGLTRAQWRVLVYVLENQGLSQSALARLMDLERAPLGQLIKSLECLRLVHRERSERDHREWLVYAGAGVEPIMPQLVEAATWLRDLSLQGLSTGEVSLLKRLLERMRANLGGDTDL
jgi:MarR family transcriptional regulator for hemolysin